MTDLCMLAQPTARLPDAPGSLGSCLRTDDDPRDIRDSTQQVSTRNIKERRPGLRILMHGIHILADNQNDMEGHIHASEVAPGPEVMKEL